MIRALILASSLTTFACGFATSSGSGVSPGGEPNEGHVPLFRAAGGAVPGSSFVDTSSTLERWRRVASGLRISSKNVLMLAPNVISVRAVDEESSEIWCSTQSLGPPPQTVFCSAEVKPGDDTNGEDHTDCSAILVDGPGSVFCSTNITIGTVQCSTKGGQSSDDSDGAVACSAGHVNPPDTANTTMNCSTLGLDTPQACSTGAGEHQACSAGNILTEGDSGKCSAFGSPANERTFCSVSASAPAGHHGNKCSAINTSPDADASHACSTGANAGEARCSVLESEATNAACTIINHEDGTNSGAACSAVLDGNPPPNQGTCSVVKPNGEIDPPVDGICGDPDIEQH